MLNKVIGGRAGRKEEARRDLAELLWVCVEAQGALVLDEGFFGRMRIGRASALTAVCDLLLAERIHLRSDSEGRMVAMSNFEFMRFILDRAENAMRAKRSPAAAGGGVCETAPGATEHGAGTEVSTARETIARVVGSETLAENGEAPDVTGEWSNFPDWRQSLPERKREPWPPFEESGAGSGKNAEYPEKASTGGER